MLRTFQFLKQKPFQKLVSRILYVIFLFALRTHLCGGSKPSQILSAFIPCGPDVSVAIQIYNPQSIHTIQRASFVTAPAFLSNVSTEKGYTTKEHSCLFPQFCLYFAMICWNYTGVPILSICLHNF